MNFYTLTSKRWIKIAFIGVFFFSFFISTINFIVDPYNITKFNFLNIQYKFTRDDRTEKINYFSKQNKFDNIMLGSSRVYSINPQVVNNILGGTTYNFGVGTATVEDILGVLLYLKRNNKLPKNLIVGIDFYTFNKDVPPNKYFLKNKELNFLSYKKYHEEYLEKFFSFDALRASAKTLNNHFFHKDQKPRFNALGWGGFYQDYSNITLDPNLVAEKKEIFNNETLFFSNYSYKHIDPKRIQYMEKIKAICKEKNINLYIFDTPLHPYALKIIESNQNLNQALQEFITYLNSFKHFTNLYHDPELYSNLKNFNGATHTTSNAGDMIMKKVLIKKIQKDSNAI